MQTCSLSQAQKYCRALARTHYENFTVGSFLLPRHLRQHIYNVYAFSRSADDLADEGNDCESNLRKLADWEQQLIACYRGEVRHPVFVALRETVQQFDIPSALFQALLQAFRQDQLVRRYETFEQLLDYCQNSANPVGRIYLYLFRLASKERFIYSDFICTALQLTNFWQDLKIDWGKGRVYIPLEDFQKFNCTISELEKSAASEAFRQLIEFEVDRTQQMFDRGKKLLQLVPAQPKFEIRLFITGGEAILDSIRKLHYNTLSVRPALTNWSKARLMAKGWWAALSSL